MKLEEEEFVSQYGTTVKLHLKQKDGSYKNFYHRYKTEDKAKTMFRLFLAGVKERN